MERSIPDFIHEFCPFGADRRSLSTIVLCTISFFERQPLAILKALYTSTNFFPLSLLALFSQQAIIIYESEVCSMKLMPASRRGSFFKNCISDIDVNMMISHPKRRRPGY